MVNAEFDLEEQMRVAALRDDLRRRYAIRINNARNVALEEGIAQPELVAEAVGIVLMSSEATWDVVNSGDHGPGRVVKVKEDLSLMRRQLGRELPEGADRNEFWEEARELAREVRDDRQLRNPPETKKPEVVRGDAELTDRTRGVAGVGGTDPHVFLGDGSHPRSFGYNQRGAK